MGRLKYIIRAIEEDIAKCSVTLKQIRADIEPTIKALTDNPEEYELLMDVIPHFYRDRYNLDHETLQIYDYNGTVYENKGNDRMVQVPDEAREIAREEGTLLGIHNHPDATCFQSPGDYGAMTSLRQKYSVTVAEDGIMISKDNTAGDIIANPQGMYYVANQWLDDNIIEGYLKKSPEYKQNLNDMREGTISIDEANTRLNKQMNDYITENIPEMTKSMEDHFHNNVSYTHDMSLTYIPVTRTY